MKHLNKEMKRLINIDVIKKCIKAIGFNLGLVVLLMVIGYYMKSGETLEAVDVVKSEVKNSGKDDIVYIGDSESVSSIIPELMEKEFGYSLYICGTTGQRLASSEEIIKQTYDIKQEKVLIYEVNNTYVKIDWDEYALSKVENTFSAVKYHDNWKEKLKRKKKTREDRKEQNNKGYNECKVVCPPPKDLYQNYMKETEEVCEVPDVNSHVVRQIKKYCDDNEIKLILVSSPSPKNWNMAKHNGVQKLADELGVDYLDGNTIKELGIDWEKDTRDGGDHLNDYGAEKLTRYVGRYIKDKGLIDAGEKR